MAWNTILAWVCLRSIFINGCNLMLLIIISIAISVWALYVCLYVCTKRVDPSSEGGPIWCLILAKMGAVQSQWKSTCFPRFYWLRLTAAIVIMFNSAMTIEINIVNNHHYLVVAGAARNQSQWYNTVREWEMPFLRKTICNELSTLALASTFPSSSSREIRKS